MSVRQLNTEYPEHLNPFHGRHSSLRQSLRGLKRAIVKSFTGKDKEKPVIRPKPDLQQTNRTLQPVEYRHTEQIAFPRSRFSERVSKTEAARSPVNNRQTVPASIANNPFDEEDENRNTKATPPKPAERTKLKRRKKRAPRPPDSANGQYLGPSVNGSEWSLVSTESELSSMCYSESEIEQVDVKNDDRNEEILKITQEIARFAQDTNNNSILDKEKRKDAVDGTNIEVKISPADDEECLNGNNEASGIDNSTKPHKLQERAAQEINGKHEDITYIDDLEEDKDKKFEKVEGSRSEETLSKKSIHQQEKEEIEPPLNLNSNISEEPDLNPNISKEPDPHQQDINYNITELDPQTEDINISKVPSPQPIVEEPNLNPNISKEPDPHQQDINYNITELDPQTEDDINISNAASRHPVVEEPSIGHQTQNIEELPEIIVSSSREINSSNHSVSEKEAENSVHLHLEQNEEVELEEKRFVRRRINVFEYTYGRSPTAKVRKEILTKEKLLGSEETL